MVISVLYDTLQMMHDKSR